MTVAFNTMPDLQLGLAAVFLCVGFGFLVLNLVFRKIKGPGFWAPSFFANAVGFLFWSGAVPIDGVAYRLIGEVFHILGFHLLVAGAMTFGNARVPKAVAIPFMLGWVLLWVLSILSFDEHPYLAGLSLKLLRALILLIGGVVLVTAKDDPNAVGKHIAGGSLALWSLYILASTIVRINGVLYYGLLAGLQILAAFGMVAMLIGTIKTNIDTMERKVEQLEGILPICSYCKKIRDENGAWHLIEEYIGTRSRAEFSHGICPECFARHRPDR